MVSIIGAGITGLVLGEYLQWADIPFRIHEASDRIGGRLHTLESDGFLLENGPSFLDLDDNLFGFLERIGLSNQMIHAYAGARKKFFVRENGTQPLPEGIISVLLGNYFSGKAKEMIWNERFKQGNWVQRESVEAFCRRRFGEEVTRQALLPLLEVQFAGNGGELLLEEAFPQLARFEKDYGSVRKGWSRTRHANRHRGRISFPKGLQQLTDTLGERLQGHIELNCPLTSLGFGERIELKFGDRVEHPSAVVLALPAHELGKMPRSSFPEVAEGMSQVNYASLAVVHTALNRSQIKHPLNGQGLWFPHTEDGPAFHTIFSSSLFPQQAPSGKVLLTSYVSGIRQPEWLEMSDAELGKKVLTALEPLGLSGDPLFQQITRQPAAIPQYDSAILASRVWLRKMELKRIYLGGNWLGGISVSNCVQRARDIAEKIIGRRPAN